MTKLDWTTPDESVRDRGRNVPSPFVAQGVRNALRNAYCGSSDAVPADFTLLLEKLR